ncbi:TetR/AcrR family transcriptional regulator [Streptomyces sp. NPDC058320]|uniref:TetR/AcrR family transcriptional regulator n=1 Tax=unclassified Streptomyces TaxID=2593676 RepID=UPI003624C20A
MTAKTSRPARRPRDRKAQILAAAVECFHRSGYHNTGMDDIATAVGITAGSLYWHFRGKQELLDQVVLTSLDLALSAVREADGLDAVLRALTSFSLDNRAFAALWDREDANLSADCRAEARQRQIEVASTVGAAVRDVRPELDDADAELIAWAALGVLGSPSYHHVDLPRPHFEDLLCALASAVCRTPALPPVVTHRPQRPQPGLTHVSRREALLAASMRLFTERGFQAVSMDDIGAAAGISGPAVYNHFKAKADLLAASLSRASAALFYDLDQALVHSADSNEALTRTVRTYSGATLAVSGSTALLANTQTQLAPADRESLHRSQVEYTAEWAGLLRRCRAELGGAEALVAVHSVFNLINFVSRLPLLQRRSDPVQALVDLSTQVLGIRAGH